MIFSRPSARSRRFPDLVGRVQVALTQDGTAVLTTIRSHMQLRHDQAISQNLLAWGLRFVVHCGETVADVAMRR